MLNDVQAYVSAFAHLALACTFGLSIAIGVAGVTQTASPFGCQTCKTSATLSAVRKV